MSGYSDLEAAAKLASKGGHHIYSHPRDDNNWRENQEFINLCHADKVLALIAESKALRHALHELANLPGLTIRQAKTIRIAMGSGEHP